MKIARQLLLAQLLFAALLLVTACQIGVKSSSSSFSLAVIPDTQNYIDFRHQKAEGFNLDSSTLFIDQMRYLAANGVNNGGEIAFVASVGDVWQHQTKTMDPDHKIRGFKIEPNPIMARNAKRTEKVLSVELPTAIEGYRIISDAGLPFGVAPGNHDYDAAWSVAGYSPNREKNFSSLEKTVKDLGILHIGGLDNFRTVFGENTKFFKNKPWYVASFKGGANSAQKFSAGGYNFLHLALEMQPGDDVIAWAASVISSYPGVPTIITTHDYQNSDGKRLPNPLIDLAQIDPKTHNSAQQLWDKLIRQHNQIFLVLCGHQRGQSFRVDRNNFGSPVYQILADYQDRGQVAVEAGHKKPQGIGDGWLRLMRFDFSTTIATIAVKTFSSYYKIFSSQVEDYADWYKEREQPNMSDTDFYAADDYTINLEGFAQRFKSARIRY